MTSNKDSSPEETATGEFQQRDIHVIAKVRVLAGRVTSVAFTVNHPSHGKHARKIADALSGANISEVLKIKAENLTFEPEPNDPALAAALLEAFHRALETCIDEG